ncbi:MAG: hypothetical protein ABIL89_03540 [candidate division WOR-3 bacterium]
MEYMKYTNKLPNVVFKTIESRRTIRKYKSVMPTEDAIRRISEVPSFILQDFIIPFTLVILQYWAKERAVNIINQTYSITRDLAILYNIVPDNLKEWWRNYMKEFIKTLGGAPIMFVGLTDLTYNRNYHFSVSWMIAQAMMVQARAEGLDTGPVGFSAKTVEEEFVNYFLRMDYNKWQIAFVLNCGYRDEEPLSRQIKEGIYEIH